MKRKGFAMPCATRIERNFGLPTFCVLIAGLIGLDSTVVNAQWPQWGGRDRNFSVSGSSLADQWPDEGPDRLWNRTLGDGYSTIVVGDGVLYTMYRKDADEFTIALSAKTGKTIWQHKNPAPVTEDRTSHGPGPYATPLIVGDRLFTVGTNSVLHCFDRKSGKVLWKHDLVAKYDAVIQGFGYSSSPIAYRNTIILPVARKLQGESDAATSEKSDGEKEEMKAQSLMAFDQVSGSLVWENRSYPKTKHTSTYSSPILINFGGEDQLVLFMTTELAGLDPTNGERLWGITHKTEWDENIATPVWDGKDTLVCSSAYGTGARGVKLSRQGGKTVATEMWYTKKLRVLHGNIVMIGDHVYGSSGDFGPTFFMGINKDTGKIAWRKRGFKKATCLNVNDKIIILDEEGELALATPTPDDLIIHSRCKLDLHNAWAVPTLVGKTLFVRDRKNIMALDLG